MGEVVLFDDPSNYEAINKRIKRLLAQGDIEIKPHAQQRMKERGWLVGDLLHGIKYGTVVSHRFVKGVCRWKVRGVTVERISITCVVEIDAALIVVTMI